LWMVPLFENERQLAVEIGSAELARKIVGPNQLPIIGPRPIAI